MDLSTYFRDAGTVQGILGLAFLALIVYCIFKGGSGKGGSGKGSSGSSNTPTTPPPAAQ